MKNIKDKHNDIVAEHLWFNYTKSFEKADMTPGDIIQFDARIKEYEKGYKGYRDDVYKPIEKDYKLNYPTKVKNLTKKKQG